MRPFPSSHRNKHRYYEAIAWCLVVATWQNYYMQTQWRDKPGLVWC